MSSAAALGLSIRRPCTRCAERVPAGELKRRLVAGPTEELCKDCWAQEHEQCVLCDDWQHKDTLEANAKVHEEKVCDRCADNLHDERNEQIDRDYPDNRCPRRE